MIREVDLMSYLPPFLAEFEEDEATLTAENPEFRLVWEASDRVLKNEFIATADAYGIARFEKFLGIFPSKGETLEDRRARVMMRWFVVLPYTVRRLIEKLVQCFGEGNFKLTVDHMHYRVEVEISSDQHSQKPELKHLLYVMVPCNMAIGIIETVWLVLIHEERASCPGIDIHAELPYFRAVFFDGSVYLDGSEKLNAETNYDLVPHFAFAIKLPWDNTAAAGISLHTEAVHSEKFEAPTAEMNVPLDYWDRKGKELDAVEADSKASVDVEAELEHDEGMELSILSEHNPAFFNGDYLLDGCIKFDSIYHKEEVS